MWRRDEYERLFAEAAPGQLVGESTPFYLYDAASHRRIREAVPGARLIALLRDPVDRAHSNWTHLWSAGLEAEGDVVRACRLEERRAAAGWAPFWRYLGLGRYGEQLARLYETFPREQVLVLRYRDLREQPAEALAADRRLPGSRARAGQRGAGRERHGARVAGPSATGPCRPHCGPATGSSGCCRTGCGCRLGTPCRGACSASSDRGSR